MKPSVHLRPFYELERATVTALAQDALGQIWFGTQSGIRCWDGLEVSSPIKAEDHVTDVWSSDSFVYINDLKALRKINIYTESVESFPYTTPDYRYGQFTEAYILAISADWSDTVLVDHHLRPIEGKGTLPKVERMEAGSYTIEHHLNGKAAIIKGTDTTTLSEALVNKVLVYAPNMVFAATQEGLVEVELGNEVNKTVHLPNQRIEKLLVDGGNNLWVSTAENGLYMFHRNVIQNQFYELRNANNEDLAAWRFAEIGGEVLVCTSNGILSLGSHSDQNNALIEATKGKFCFSVVETPNFILIGTAREGLYKFSAVGLEQVFFSAEESKDNAVLQILKNDQGYVFSTKWGFHQLDHQGRLTYSRPFPQQFGEGYSMKLLPEGDGYISVATNGILEYTSDFKLLGRVSHPAARVFSDLADFDHRRWFSSMDGGLFRFSGDSLLKVYSPQDKLFALMESSNALWATGADGVFRLSNDGFVVYDIDNGFPIGEYSQGGLYGKNDSTIYFSGLGGVFKYHTQSAESISLPAWHVKCNNEFLPPTQHKVLTYEQAILNLEPRCIVTSNHNRFTLSYHNGKESVPFENGEPLLVPVDYGATTIQFSVQNVLTHEQNMVEYTFYRERPIWLKLWFRFFLALVSVALLVGMYALFRYLKTRKLLKKELEERKVAQERLRISRELHDNIGARLSHIISSLDIELYKNQASDQIAIINAFARETMTQLRETIWAVSDRTIFFSELKQRIEHYLTQAHKISTIDIQLSDCTTSDFELNATQSINLFRIVQEAVNNAIKYSSASKIEVTLSEQNGRTSIAIQDNGVGFVPEESIKYGSGIKGLYGRAKEMDAELSIHSQPKEGAKIEVSWTH